MQALILAAALKHDDGWCCLQQHSIGAQPHISHQEQNVSWQTIENLPCSGVHTHKKEKVLKGYGPNIDFLASSFFFRNETLKIASVPHHSFVFFQGDAVAQHSECAAARKVLRISSQIDEDRLSAADARCRAAAAAAAPPKQLPKHLRNRSSFLKYLRCSSVAPRLLVY